MKSAAVFILTYFVLIAGISAQDVKTPENGSDDPAKVSDVALKADAETNQTIPGREKDERYRIGFQDILQITVPRHPDLSLTVSVAQDGTILLPRINEPIVAVCKTERELASLIAELYNRDYLRNPFVNVRTLEQRSQPFSVIGAVNKPGQFYGSQRIRLLTLLALAGGQDVENAGSRVQVFRAGNLSSCTPDDGNDTEVQFFSYSINDVLSGRENPWMQPGDIVSVLEAEEAYVVGDVFEPAKIKLKEPVTLSEAIAQAGGLNDTAKISKVIIHRKEKNSPVRTELAFNLKDIREKSIADPVLQGNDIIEVSTSKSKLVKKGIWDIFTKSIPNIFYRLPL